MALPLIIAGIAALAILFIFFGLAGSRPVDPVQARLTQRGWMQARSLEELELQQPFFERTVRPLALRLSGAVQRVTSPRQTSRTERRPAQAGNPPDLHTTSCPSSGWAVASRRAARRSCWPSPTPSTC